MDQVLVIVDMVNGFINGGTLSDKKINKITPNIVAMVKDAIKKRIPIIAFRDCHSENDEEFKVYPAHCIKGSVEAELIPELKKYEKHFTIIDKNTTNGFNTKLFQEIMEYKYFDRVVVTGCCTDICVENFVNSYLEFNKKNNYNTKICVVENATATFNLPKHEAATEHEKALTRIKNSGAAIVTYPIKEETEQK